METQITDTSYQKKRLNRDELLKLEDMMKERWG